MDKVAELSAESDAPAVSADELSLRILWWNIAIAPLGVEKEMSTNRLQEVVETLVDLMLVLDIDVFCLGEVSDRILREIEFLLEDTPYEIFNAIETVRRAKFDSCVVFNGAKVKLDDSTPVVLDHVSSAQKICHRLVFEVLETKEPLFVYVSHWPSRLRQGPGTSYRMNLGANLRTSLNVVFKDFGARTNIIILGDFNDEPYDAPMTDFLKSSRDRDLVRSRESDFFIYNPFWSFLSQPQKYTRSEDALKCHGTYTFSSSLLTSNSHVFDQILFSSSFISAGPWYLEEESVEIIGANHSVAGLHVETMGSDHKPVIAEVRRVLQ